MADPAPQAAIPVEEEEDNPRLRLTVDEVERAQQIKAAVEAHEEIFPKLSDFEYVQYALATGEETMEAVCTRVFAMQSFRLEYRLHDTVEEGIELARKMELLQPGMVLAVDYIPSTGNYLNVCDYAEYYPSKIKTDEDFRIFLGAFYYYWNAQNPDFTAIRLGFSALVECMDANFDNCCLDTEAKLVHELFKVYPRNTHQAFFLNSPTVANLFFQFSKPYLPDRITKAFHLGVQIQELEGQRIDILYKQPTPEKALERMMLKVHGYLRLREKNMASFKLSEALLIP